MIRGSIRVIIASLCLLSGRAAFADGSDEALTFERDIRPIFKAHCFDCHGATAEMEGSLDLRLVRLSIEGGDSGPAIVPGKPDESYLVQRIRAGEMPPGSGKVPAEQLALLERWIAAGAKTARPEPEQLDAGVGISPEEREFWSFQPIRRPTVPRVDPQDRARTPVDALLLAAMKPKGLSFSPDASPHILVHRLYFDLIGLPPTPEEVDAFVAAWADDPDQACEQWVDRLFASPHYGERWARHWLDAAGYADSEGFTNDDPLRPWAFRFRDYVIRSLNVGKPLDRFVAEQLAGDELAGAKNGEWTEDQIELLSATGLLRMAADGTASGGVDLDLARNQNVADTLKIVSTSLLGLSVACAQCHDHRYDPITHADYHRLRAVFEPALDWKRWQSPNQRRVSLYTQADHQRAAELEAEAKEIQDERTAKQTEYIDEALEKELAKFDEPLREQLRAAYKTAAGERTPEQRELLKKHPSVNISPGVLYQYNQGAADELKKYDERIAAIRAQKPAEEFIHALVEPANHSPTTHLFHRGDHRQPKEVIPPGDLTIASPPGEPFQITEDDPSLPTTGRRLAYAKWLTSGEHPLTGRVLANRVWMHFFGRGIVGTPGDFGQLGERPTHPELLDWLADELAASGWDLKRLQRNFVLSTAYRQSSASDPAKAEIDGENRYLWRMPVRRLDAEAIRDRALAASGALHPAKMFGPPSPVEVDDTGQAAAKDDSRRSLYIQVRRSQPESLLTAFDQPVMETNCERRFFSTVATQSLMMMNGDFLLRQSTALADRARHEASHEPPPSLRGDLASLSIESPWKFGYGWFDEASGHVASFTPLPHWTGSAWQGGPSLPDGQLGWVLLHAAGGHPGEAQQAAIRRWVAPRDGEVSITGALRHSSDQGDGVRGRVVLSGSGKAGEWAVHNAEEKTPLAKTAVRQGETIDFVTDCRDNPGYDGFAWTVEITFQAPGGEPVTWKSESGVKGPSPDAPLAQQAARAWRLAYGRGATSEELTLVMGYLADQVHTLAAAGNADPARQAMANLCQVLLGSNEFLYVE